MVPKCIILGEISKKLLLPFIFAASQIAHKMFSRYFYPQKKSNMVLDLYFTSFGMMSILFLPCILKIKSVESDKERLIHKKKYLHYFLLGFIFLIYTLMKLIPNIMKGVYALEKNKAINGFSEGAFLIMGIEMIFLAIFSYFLLKYRYYKHHIISMIAFIICITNYFGWSSLKSLSQLVNEDLRELMNKLIIVILLNFLVFYQIQYIIYIKNI